MGTKHVCRFNYLVVGAGALGGGGYRVDRVYQIGCLSWKRGFRKELSNNKIFKRAHWRGQLHSCCCPSPGRRGSTYMMMSDNLNSDDRQDYGRNSPAAGMFGGIQGGIGTAPGFTVSPTHLRDH